MRHALLLGVLLVAVLAGCIDPSHARSPTTCEPQRASTTCGGTAEVAVASARSNATTRAASNATTTAALPAPWHGDYPATFVATKCSEEGRETLGATPGLGYAAPSKRALAGAKTTHVSVSWNRTLGAISFGLSAGGKALVSGTSTTSPAVTRTDASRVQPDAEYGFWACPRLPGAFVLTDLGVDVWYS